MNALEVVIPFLVVLVLAAAGTLWASRVLRASLEEEEQEEGCGHEAFMDGRCMECGTPTDSI